MTTPTREEIIRMARGAGFQTGVFDYQDGQGTYSFIRPLGENCTVEAEKLVKAAYAAGAADEREAMLDMVDSYAKNNTDLRAAIRARGITPDSQHPN